MAFSKNDGSCCDEAAAAGIELPFVKRGVSKIEGMPLISGKLTGVKQLSDEDATDKETMRNYFSKIEGLPSILT